MTYIYSATEQESKTFDFIVDQDVQLAECRNPHAMIHANDLHVL